MTTKPFPRHGVTIQNGRELIALSAVKALEVSLRDGSQTGIDVRGLKPTAILPRIENREISTHQAEGNRDLEIATCPANHPETAQPWQSRFLNRGSLPKKNLL
jgi:hypothetical protein